MKLEFLKIYQFNKSHRYYTFIGYVNGKQYIKVYPRPKYDYIFKDYANTQDIARITEQHNMLEKDFFALRK